MAVVAEAQLAAGEGDAAFLRAKLESARFYFERILPRTLALEESLAAGPASLMGLEADAFFMP